jgi:hypothetical protein
MAMAKSGLPPFPSLPSPPSLLPSSDLSPRSYSEFLLAMSCDAMGKTSRKSSGQFSDEAKSFREGLGGLRKNGSFVMNNVRAGLSGLTRFGSAARIATTSTSAHDDLVVQNYEPKLSGSVENV